MNTKIISKCLDELKKESPDLSYIRGMLETLVEVDSPISHYAQGNTLLSGDIGSAYRIPMSTEHGAGGMASVRSTNIPTSPEGAAVDAALAMIGGIQPKPGVVTIEKNVLLNGTM